MNSLDRIASIIREQTRLINSVTPLLAAEQILAEFNVTEREDCALNKRRDEIALEFTADTRGTLSGACNYAGLLPWTRRMIDRIIELEQAQS